MSEAAGGAPEAVLYTRPDCPLCFAMHRAAGRCARRHGVTLRVVDIGGSADLWARYRDEVPILELPGGRSFRGRAAAGALDEAFREARRAFRSRVER